MTAYKQIAESGDQISEESYAFLQQHVYRESGIVIESGKHYLLEARLMPIVRRESLRTLNDLCALLKATENQPLKREVVEAMTTNETLFFRDTAPFEALKQVIVPEFVKDRQQSQRLSFWSAAASTGQEAYSLAIMLAEMGLSHWSIRILGTDLCAKVLAKATLGRYAQVEVNRGLPVTCLIKYFDRVGLEWQVREPIRRMAAFEQFDLRQSMRGKGPFDVILCRNVLIYFDTETKRKILDEMRRTLAPGGYLLLGAAETTLGLTDAFVRRQIGSAIFYQLR